MGVNYTAWEVDISNLPVPDREPLYKKLSGVGWDAYWNEPPYTTIKVLIPEGKQLRDLVSIPDICIVRKV